MLRFVANRLATLVPVLWGVSLLVFLAMNFIPGDVATIFLGINANPELLETFRERFGLNRPLYVRYLEWLVGLLHGSFGRSFTTGVDVGQELWQRFPVTLELALLAILIANLVGIPAGIAAAMRHRTRVDTGVSVVALGGLSTPGFWLGTLLVLIFALRLKWLPSGGYVPLTEDPLENLRLMLLPALSLGLVSGSVIMRNTRSAMLEVLRQDYMTTARAKGTPSDKLITRHALKNALVPVVTVMGLELSANFGGAVLIESIFLIPGVGSLALLGISQRDYPIVQGAVMLVAAFVVIVNLATDVCYAYLDPRKRG
jgi:peptide/nickel transport system permease protein